MVFATYQSMREKGASWAGPSLKVYDLDIDNTLNRYYRMAEHNDNSNNDNKEHIPRAKLTPIKKNKKIKPSSLTVKETSLKVSNSRETNNKYKDETMDISYNKEEY